MERILPFKGIRYNKNIVGNLSAVIAPPFDVITPEGQKKLCDSHPFNIVRLECGMKAETDTDADNRYTRSAKTLEEWMHSGILVHDRQPSFYILSQEFESEGGRQLNVKGVVCLVRLEDLPEGKVFPHENTLSKQKADRLRLMTECGANFSPVYALFEDDDKRLSRLISAGSEKPPETLVNCPDKTVQKLWTVTDEQTISEISSVLEDKNIFIVDGHQRYAAAMEYRNIMREKNPDHTGRELYNYVMMFLADANCQGIKLAPVHRLVKNIVGFNEPSIISDIEQSFDVEQVMTEDAQASARKQLDGNSFIMYTGKDYYYRLKLKDYSVLEPEKSDTLKRLALTALHSVIFDKVFDMSETDIKNQIYLSYTEDISKAINEVKNGNYQCSFILKPNKVSEVMEVALMGEKMPQKSTFFYPKLKTGLIINKFI